jgi:hypothetical protein
MKPLAKSLTVASLLIAAVPNMAAAGGFIIRSRWARRNK